MDSINTRLDPVSRTFDDGELDAEMTPTALISTPVASWTRGVTKVDTLIFAATAEASCFLGCSVPADAEECGTVAVEVTGRLQTQPDTARLIRRRRLIPYYFSPQGHGTWTFSLRGGVMFALCDAGAKAPPEISWEFLDCLLEGCDFAKAIVLHSGHFAQFVAGNPHIVQDGEMSTLRHLKTDAFPLGDEVCPALEAPNVIDGLPAAILSHCQVLQKPAVIYSCVQSESEAGVEMMRKWDPVLKQIGLTAPAHDSAYEKAIGAMMASDPALSVYT